MELIDIFIQYFCNLPYSLNLLQLLMINSYLHIEIVQMHNIEYFEVVLDME
jgi:hypothetical protein